LRLPEEPKSSSSHFRPATAAQAESQLSLNQASPANLTASVLNAPDVRQGKIEALQARLQRGTYKVSSESIAASLLADTRTIDIAGYELFPNQR